MSQEKNNVLIKNGYISVPNTIQNANNSVREIATIVNNMNFYGYTPSKDTLDALFLLDKSETKYFWLLLQNSLEEITGNDRNMGDFIVYKNFPQEVLEQSESELLINQILIYLGVPVDMVVQEEKERPKLTQQVDYKVLTLANEDTFSTIFKNLQEKNSAWNDTEKESALVLFKNDEIHVELSDFVFKENGVLLAKEAFKEGVVISANNATDVLRIALENNENNRSDMRFRKLKRAERLFLLNLLENSKNLEDDMAMKRKLWKKFLKHLHPSDYPVKRVHKAYDALYNGKLKSFDATFKKAMENDHEEAMSLAKTRVGFFIRNIHFMYSVIGSKALVNLAMVLDKATLIQLVKLEKYLSTVNERKVFLVAPNGNWKKLQFIENNKKKITEEDLSFIINAISKVINDKLNIKFPNGVFLDEKTKEVMLPSNDLELDFYGRGTSFDIPNNINFIRTASYWAIKNSSNVWFDNGFNFLKDDFTPLDSCFWNKQKFDKGAIFSGDPLNKDDKKGRGCQMIDLNIEELIKSGARYASWNVLSYNDIPFNQADDLLLTLQLSEDNLKGNTYEPSLASMIFKIGGNNKAKEVAYIDLVERKVVFLDLNLRAFLSSASSNINNLSETLPFVLEHFKYSPSVYDLFKHMDNKVDKLPKISDLENYPAVVAYSDKSLNVLDGASAFFLESVNEENTVSKIDILSL